MSVSQQFCMSCGENLAPRLGDEKDRMRCSVCGFENVIQGQRMGRAGQSPKVMDGEPEILKTPPRPHGFEWSEDELILSSSHVLPKRGCLICADRECQVRSRLIWNSKMTNEAALTCVVLWPIGALWHLAAEHSGTRVRLEIPLCTKCDASWSGAETLHTTAALALAPLLWMLVFAWLKLVESVAPKAGPAVILTGIAVVILGAGFFWYYLETTVRGRAQAICTNRGGSRSFRIQFTPQTTPRSDSQNSDRIKLRLPNPELIQLLWK